MEREKGWQCVDYDFDELYDAGINFAFEYKGKKYYLQRDKSPTDVFVYALPEGVDSYADLTESQVNIIAVYHTKDEMYNAILFGLPILQVVEDSYILYIE